MKRGLRFDAVTCAERSEPAAMKDRRSRAMIAPALFEHAASQLSVVGVKASPCDDLQGGKRLPIPSDSCFNDLTIHIVRREMRLICQHCFPPISSEPAHSLCHNLPLCNQETMLPTKELGRLFRAIVRRATLVSVMVLTVLMVFTVGCAVIGGREDTRPTTVYVVRHAEKQMDAGKDPGLTPLGERRAQALTNSIKGPIDAIYATELQRTLLTVQPMAGMRGLEVRVVPATETDTLVHRILTENRGQVVLVAGHSNTVPKIIQELGVETPVTIAEQDHGDLFVVTITADGTRTMTRSHFGP